MLHRGFLNACTSPRPTPAIVLPTDLVLHTTREQGRPMRKIKRGWILTGLILVLILVVPVVAWVSLTHQPHFYRASTSMTKERRQAEAKRFVAQSLQLRNDI